jgi:hypothetical protein
VPLRDYVRLTTEGSAPDLPRLLEWLERQVRCPPVWQGIVDFSDIVLARALFFETQSPTPVSTHWPDFADCRMASQTFWVWTAVRKVGSA